MAGCHGEKELVLAIAVAADSKYTLVALKMNDCTTYTRYIVSCRIREVSWMCLAVMLLLSVMPFVVGALSTSDGQGLGLEEAALGEHPGLLASVVQCVSRPGSSLLRSLHLPDLSFHPPA